MKRAYLFLKFALFGHICCLCPDPVTANPLEDLKQWLAHPHSARPPLADQAFSKQALSKSEAVQARELLWTDMVARLKAERADAFEKKLIELDGKEMKYDYRTFGKEPEGGHSLFISMHGGGNTRPEVNDRQWKNQIGLYEPEEGIYVAPRAPTDTWNLWHQEHIDPMFDQLIADFVILKGVNPNRVYLMGYSAGGDGVFQLAPRMADRFAAAAMMAGHPNETKPDGLRNLPFTLHMGGKDAAYDRNKVAADWKEALARLRDANPDAYVHHVKIHKGKGHWMQKEDAVAVPWMAKFNRNPWPKKITWLQDDVVHTRFYWIAIESADAKKRQRIEVSVERQTIRITAEEKTPVTVTLRLDDTLIDLNKPIVVAQASTQFEGKVSRTIQALSQSLDERVDPQTAASALLTVKILGESPE